MATQLLQSHTGFRTFWDLGRRCRGKGWERGLYKAPPPPFSLFRHCWLGSAGCHFVTRTDWLPSVLKKTWRRKGSQFRPEVVGSCHVIIWRLGSHNSSISTMWSGAPYCQRNSHGKPYSHYPFCRHGCLWSSDWHSRRFRSHLRLIQVTQRCENIYKKNTSPPLNSVLVLVSAKCITYEGLLFKKYINKNIESQFSV